MEFFDLIASRQSCRNFDAARPVEREKLKKIMEAARLAPSACNGQPWRYSVVTNGEKVRALAKATQGAGMNRFTNDCPVFIVVQEHRSNLTAQIGGLIAGQSFSPIDIGLSVMQLCLAATDLGLASCVLGWFDEKIVRSVLMPEDKDAARLLICVGYAKDGTARPKARKPLSEIVRFLD